MPSETLLESKNMNISQFEIHGGVKKQLQAYLDEKGIDLKTAMDNEETNNEVATIIHAGLPMLVRKIYPLPKMHTFFWEKRDLMAEFIAQRLVEKVKAKK